MSATTAAARFDALRARYLAARTKLGEHEAALRSKYGRDPARSWLQRGEEKELDRRSAAVAKASAAFMQHLALISPRDWSYGVPCFWLYESLSYEDAVRPLGERLAVVPPRAYGAREPRA